MAGKRTIIWSDVSEKDLTAIIENIATDSIANAAKVFQKIKAAA